MESLKNYPIPPKELISGRKSILSILLEMKALKLVLLLLFIIKLTASYSQNDTPKFQFGVKASPAISWLSPETKFYKNDGTKLGFAWGFVTDFHLLNNYFISTGFSVNYVNGKLKFPSEVQVESIVVKGTMLRDYRMRFLEFPFLFKMKTNSFGDYRFYGQMGFITGFNIKSRSVDVFYPETGPTINDELDIYDETTFARINLAVGGGAEYKIDNSTSIFFGLMFHNGLTDVLSGKNPVDFRTEKAVPNALEVTFGVMF